MRAQLHPLICLSTFACALTLGCGSPNDKDMPSSDASAEEDGTVTEEEGEAAGEEGTCRDNQTSSGTGPETGMCPGDGDGDAEAEATGDGDGDGDASTGDGDGDGDSSTGDGDGDGDCTGDITVAVSSSVETGNDECGHASFINLPMLQSLMVSITGTTVTITSSGDPWVMATGTVNGCMITATGTGDIAGFAGTECEYMFTIDASGDLLSGTYTCGTQGELPGACPITYTLVAG